MILVVGQDYNDSQPFLANCCINGKIMATNILVKVLGHMDTLLIISFSSSMQYGFSPFSISIMQKYNLLKMLNVTENILWVRDIVNTV